MRRVLAAIIAAVAIPGAACAQFSESGQANTPVDTAAKARAASDETPVVLTGRITERIRSETYRFADQTGSIVLDIGEEVWRGARVSPDHEVRITGEVDRTLAGNEIWVHRIERLD